MFISVFTFVLLTFSFKILHLSLFTFALLCEILFNSQEIPLIFISVDTVITSQWQYVFTGITPFPKPTERWKVIPVRRYKGVINHVKMKSADFSSPVWTMWWFNKDATTWDKVIFLFFFSFTEIACLLFIDLNVAAPEIFCGGHWGGKMCYWGGKNPKICQKRLNEWST